MDRKDFPNTYSIIIILLVTATTALCAPHQPTCGCSTNPFNEIENARKSRATTDQSDHFKAMNRSLSTAESKFECWDDMFKFLQQDTEIRMMNFTALKFTTMLNKQCHLHRFYKLTCDLEKFLDVYINKTSTMDYDTPKLEPVNCRLRLLQDQLFSLKQVRIEMHECLKNRPNFTDSYTIHKKNSLNQLIKEKYDYTNITRIDNFVHYIYQKLIKKIKDKISHRITCPSKKQNKRKDKKGKGKRVKATSNQDDKKNKSSSPTKCPRMEESNSDNSKVRGSAKKQRMKNKLCNKRKRNGHKNGQKKVSNLKN